MNRGRAAASLQRVDAHDMHLTPDAIVACIVVRNEVDRLHGLLEHHRRLGVDRFFFVDNDSDDDTVERLLSQPDVHLWRSTMSFREADYGARWFEAILDRHALGHWVVIVDADELLWFDGCEERTLADLCAELDRDGHRALSAVLLDLYPEGPLATTRLPDDRSPLDVARWFDRRWCHTMVGNAGPNCEHVGAFGGVRRRLFGGDDWDYCLSKVPLLRYEGDTELGGGQHWTALPLAPSRAAVLHFKLDARLVELAWQELERGQRATHAQEYLGPAERLVLVPDTTAYDETQSVEFTGSAQLRAMGIIGPIDDPRDAHLRAGALLQQAEVRISEGETARAVALLGRAADVQPTSVAPVLRLAALRLAEGDTVAADTAFDEAIARRPGDLDVASLVFEARTARPPWAAAAEAAIAALDPSIRVESDVAGAFTRTEALGIPRPVHREPWIGVVDAVIEEVAPFGRRSLPALWASPQFQQSLERCRSLIALSRPTAEWLQARTAVPVLAVRPPIASASVTFDPDRQASTSRTVVVQPGVWLTDVTSICDLPVASNGRNEVHKVRCSPAGTGPFAAALARGQRRTGRRVPRLRSVGATTDIGAVDAATMHGLFETSIVLADVFDACADPVVLACIASTTPVLVPHRAAIVDLLGPDYPLLFESLEHAAALVDDVDAVLRAHRRLVDVRDAHTTASFTDAIIGAFDEVPTP